VLDDEREIRRLTARRAANLIRAKREQVRPSEFEHRILANRAFRAEISAMLNIPEKQAESLIGNSDALVDIFPRTLDAMGRGEISWQHAVVIVDELCSLEATVRGELEQKALADAPQVTPGKLRRIVRLARESAAPETITERQEQAVHFRGVSFADESDGMSTLFFTASSVHIHAIFDRLTKAAKATDGPLEERTLNQRRADVLTHVLLAEVDGMPFGLVPDEFDDLDFVRWYRGISANVVISVPVLTLLDQSHEPATLDGWVPIDRDTARILAAGADSFIRVLTHPETGSILSVGRKRYRVPKDLKRVIQIRDLTCRFPGCELEAARTDLDHSHEWHNGGETKVSNIGCVCRGHHSLKTAGYWTVTTDEQGVMTWTTNTGRSYITRPHRPLAA
jgi:hypothetical protein